MDPTESDQSPNPYSAPSAELGGPDPRADRGYLRQMCASAVAVFGLLMVVIAVSGPTHFTDLIPALFTAAVLGSLHGAATRFLGRRVPVVTELGWGVLLLDLLVVLAALDTARRGDGLGVREWLTGLTACSLAGGGAVGLARLLRRVGRR